MKNVDMIFIHLGHPKFNLNLFQNISNDRDWVKPRGGLWASPLTAKFGWKDWITTNNFELDKYNQDSFIFKLSDSAKILYIDTADKLDDLPKGTNIIGDMLHSWIVLDFEKLAEEYDAMLVLISNDFKLYWDLYGWDCDTLLVFNPDVIEEVD